jgi:hypothetical protein
MNFQSSKIAELQLQMKQLKLMQTLLKQMQGCRCNAFEEYGKKLLSKKLETTLHARSDQARTLQIFVHPRSNAIQCLLDVLDGVGNAEAEVALAEIAKGSAGERRDAGVVE